MKLSITEKYLHLIADVSVVAAEGDWVTQVAIKNWAAFTNCMSKNQRKIKEDGENLDLIMLMYDLLKNSSNYSSLCF